MAKYKTKEKIIDAIQWNGTEKSCHDVIAFCSDIFWSPPDILVLDNKEGSLQIYKNDYIIKDNEEFYILDSESFENQFKLIK